MKTKILIILIILSSLISWFIWAFLFLNLNKWEEIEVINNSTKEVTKIITNEKVTDIVSLENQITSTIEKVSPSVVSIIIKKDLVIYRSDPWGFFNKANIITNKEVWGWTWFFVTKDWKIITNKHVISDTDAEYTIITHDNKEYDAKILAVSWNNDIAVLKIKTDEKLNFVPLTFIENKDSVKIGQFAIAIGNALSEFQNSVSFWVVSWKDRTIKDWENILRELIQTDAAINYWNSWWPLLNIAWEVIWINTAIIEWSNWIWFSINLTQDKIDYITSSIDKSWEIKEAYIWINYIPISEWIKKEFELNSDYWLYIIDEVWWIIAWSPADNVWIKPWDIILEANEQKLSETNGLNELIKNKLPWEKIKLKILKSDWKELSIELILWEK